MYETASKYRELFRHSFPTKSRALTVALTADRSRASYAIFQFNSIFFSFVRTEDSLYYRFREFAAIDFGSIIDGSIIEL